MSGAKQTEALRLADWLESAATVADMGRKPEKRDRKRLAASELRRLDAENTALRKCAIKYLQWLNIKNPAVALNSDILNPEMTE